MYFNENIRGFFIFKPLANFPDMKITNKFHL